MHTVIATSIAGERGQNLTAADFSDAHTMDMFPASSRKDYSTDHPFAGCW